LEEGTLKEYDEKGQLVRIANCKSGTCLTQWKKINMLKVLPFAILLPLFTRYRGLVSGLRSGDRRAACFSVYGTACLGPHHCHGRDADRVKDDDPVFAAANPGL